MSDANTDNNTDNGQTVQMAPTPLRFVAQYVKDFSFEVPHAPGIYTEIRKRPPDIPVSFECDTRHISRNMFEVTVRINVRANVGETPAFVLEVVYGTLVEIDENLVPENQLHPVLLIEIPRFMFPDMRKVIGDMTTYGGFPPLYLQPVDFGAIYQRKYGNQPQTVPRVTAAA